MTITMTVEGRSAVEDSGLAIQYIVRLSEPAPAGGVSVNYRTASGTAESQVDFDYLSGTLTFAEGQREAEINVRERVGSNFEDEADESVILELFEPTGASLAGDAPLLRSTGIILDNDGAGNDRALFVSDATVIEGEQAVFELSLSRPSSEVLSFNYSTQNGSADTLDYQSVNGTVTFAPGQTTASVAIDVNQDFISEFDESFMLRVEPNDALANETDPIDATATIIDVEPLMNSVPVAVEDSYALDQGATLNVGSDEGVLINDRDADDDRLTAQLVYDVTQGELVFNANGSFSYTHNGSNILSDSFTYLIDDGRNVSETVTVSLSINEALNTLPIARDDSGIGFATDENTAFTTASVLLNDSDIDSADTLSVVSFGTQGTLGSVTNTGNPPL